LKELNDLDLYGAPYAYTPFCDSRKEMDGFRCDMCNKAEYNIFSMHRYLFSIFPFSFDMDRNEKVEKVMLPSIQGVQYAFAVQSTTITLRSFFGYLLILS